jgi:hypothetical protein
MPNVRFEAALEQAGLGRLVDDVWQEPVPPPPPPGEAARILAELAQLANRPRPAGDERLGAVQRLQDQLEADARRRDNPVNQLEQQHRFFASTGATAPPDPVTNSEGKALNARSKSTDLYRALVHKSKQHMEAKRQNENLREEMDRRERRLVDAVSFTKALNYALKHQGSKLRIKKPTSQRDLVQKLTEILWHTCGTKEVEIFD